MTAATTAIAIAITQDLYGYEASLVNHEKTDIVGSPLTMPATGFIEPSER